MYAQKEEKNFLTERKNDVYMLPNNLGFSAMMTQDKIDGLYKQQFNTPEWYPMLKDIDAGMVQSPQWKSIFGSNDNMIVVNLPQHRVWGLTFKTPHNDKVFVPSTTLKEMMHAGHILYQNRTVSKHETSGILADIKSNLDAIPAESLDKTINTYRLVKSKQAITQP